jgi:peptide/nickel transport system substrate-binding protein
MRCGAQLYRLLQSRGRQADRSEINGAGPGQAQKLVWEIERRLAEDGARPVIFYPRGGTCRQPWVKGLTIMVNSIYNGWRYEDVWLDK